MAARTAVRRWLGEIARSYAQVLFGHSPWAGLLLLVATASEPTTFVVGVLAVLEASLLGKALGFDAQLRASGYFGYNPFLVGAGIGHLWAGSWLCLPMVAIASALAVVLTAAVRACLTRHLGLPVLSVPFLIVFWLVAWAAPLLGALPTPSAGDIAPAGLALPAVVTRYLSCLGSLFFVPTVVGGALVALALLVHSRMASLWAVTTFVLVAIGSDFLPAQVSLSGSGGLAANAMLLAIAVAGVWFVPSRWSVLWACAAGIVCGLVTAGIQRPFGALGIPVLFAPFNLVSYAILLAARERTRDARPKSVDFAPGSPEENRDYVLNRRLRFPLSNGLALQLPFRGRWTCTQGVDGEPTHQGPWRHAFDFQVVGEDGEMFVGSPRELTSYHCFRLPVLAAAAGVVVKVETDLPDNPVGKMDLVHNWGNIVVLQHGPGLFSLVAHLARGSVKVKEGQHVGQGEVLGLCGSSGRSPVPHLHFHLQVAPQAGSATLPSAFAAVVRACGPGEMLEISHVPGKGDVCRNLEPSAELARRLGLRPGGHWRLRGASEGAAIEEIDIDIDLYGQTRLRTERATVFCAQTAHLQRTLDATGDRHSLLSLWPAALPTVPFEDNPALGWSDYVPARGLPGRSLLDRLAALILAPAPLRVRYAIHRTGSDLVIEGASLRPDRWGLPLLRTRVVFDGREGPASIEVAHGNRTAKASRVAVPALSVVAPLSARSGFADPARNLAAHSSEPTNSN